MWFGDNVTLREWNDIFNNEAYASWAQWGYNERTGGSKANDELNETYDQYAGDAEFWQITMIDPGRQHLFDAVYVRGPMALQALRNVIGDEAFFRLAREWAQAPGSRSLEDWMAAAQALTTVDLEPVLPGLDLLPHRPGADRRERLPLDSPRSTNQDLLGRRSRRRDSFERLVRRSRARRLG